MDNVIIIGSGMDNARLEIIKAKFEKIGHEVIIVNSKEEAFNLKGTTITNEDLIKVFESIPKENKNESLFKKLYSEPKSFVLKSYDRDLKHLIKDNNNGPIGAIFKNNKKRRR